MHERVCWAVAGALSLAACGSTVVDRSQVVDTTLPNGTAPIAMTTTDLMTTDMNTAVLDDANAAADNMDAMADALADMDTSKPSDAPSSSYPADGGSMLDGAPASDADEVEMTEGSGNSL